MVFPPEVTVLTPPAFLVHAQDDDICPYTESTIFSEKLMEKNIPVEMHIYPKGGHGFGCPNPNNPGQAIDEWLGQYIRWVKERYRLNIKNILKLDPTRTRRTYEGGKKIDEWYNVSLPADSNRPEAWIASTVSARNPGMSPVQNEGLSKIISHDPTESVYLKDLIESEPLSMLGKEHVRRHGAVTGVLVKIIDSLTRLTIQVHPDKTFARDIFHSEFGKTEAWYILGGRKIDGEDPYVLFGFKPGITRALWEQLFHNQDIPAMLDSLHKIRVKPGDVFFIEGGVPHAIGSGCFLIEVQEPTDYTLRPERATPEGVPLSDELCHQGAGSDALFDAFHYDGYSLEQTLKKWKLSPESLIDQESAREDVLIGTKTTRLFTMNRLTVKGEYEYEGDDTFKACIIIEGKGTVTCHGIQSSIKKGEFFLIPAVVKKNQIKNEEDQPFNIIVCGPPV